MKNIDVILQRDQLASLVQKENFVGWVYNINYESALVLTNDLWKSKALGVPHNGFLIAASFDPDRFSETAEADKEVILLRVVGSCKLPQDDDMVKTKVDHFQQQTESFAGAGLDFDDLTKNQIQFGGLECRVLGTFYMHDGQLWLGSDLESFTGAARLNVYRPRKDALLSIVNYVDPNRKATAIEEARLLGLETAIQPFRIGTVRYTSTARLHRQKIEDWVPVTVQPSDFLARRTAVLGMTRTGKSNMVKQMVSVVKRVADEGGLSIGQIIYDLNGEYANANQQDKGSIADIYPTETVRYRMLQTEGFRELQNNFYIQLNEGLSIIRSVVAENNANAAADVKIFLNCSLDEPDKQDYSSHKRWQIKVAAYQAMLFKAGFVPPANFSVKFTANEEVRKVVEAAAGKKLGDPSKGMKVDSAVDWFSACRNANAAGSLPPSSSGSKWLDDETSAILNMLTNQSASNNAYINGYKVLTGAQKYHSARRAQEVGEEIYDLLDQGKIVILDLSVGDPTLRERISKQIANEIFRKSMDYFINSDTPPNIVVYIEEAHNLIGKDMDLTETWPRLAKEGAKYRIGLVYATQEVSSVHPNILSNTENWFISHLNNEREIKELSKFYDFADFAKSLMRAQDVGFTRVKTLSSPFVVPVQIDKFDPEEERKRAASVVKPKGKVYKAKIQG